jgi:hypothetical protein
MNWGFSKVGIWFNFVFIILMIISVLSFIAVRMEVLIIQNNLTSLSREMVHNGYPAIQHFQADGRYHRFAINGYKNQPGYYAIEQKTSGLSAVYGDFVSNKKYF